MATNTIFTMQQISEAVELGGGNWRMPDAALVGRCDLIPSVVAAIREQGGCYMREAPDDHIPSLNKRIFGIGVAPVVAGDRRVTQFDEDMWETIAMDLIDLTIGRAAPQPAALAVVASCRFCGSDIRADGASAFGGLLCPLSAGGEGHHRA